MTSVPLVLADHYKLESEKNDQWMEDKMKIAYSKSKVKHANNATAFYSGVEYGNNVSLSNGGIGKK